VQGKIKSCSLPPDFDPRRIVEDIRQAVDTMRPEQLENRHELTLHMGKYPVLEWVEIEGAGGKKNIRWGQEIRGKNGRKICQRVKEIALAHGGLFGGRCGLQKVSIRLRVVVDPARRQQSSC
jgi:hypothetical protein